MTEGNKLTVRVNDRTMTINIIDLLEAMDEEGRQEIISHFAWEGKIWDEVKRMFADEFAAPSWNANIHEARLEFLKARFAGDTLARVVKELLNELARVKNNNAELDKAFWAWRNWYQYLRGWLADRDMKPSEPPAIVHPTLVHLKDSDVLKWLESLGVMIEDEVEAALADAEKDHAAHVEKLSNDLKDLQAKCPHPADRIDSGVCGDCGLLIEWPF